jgi:hypothetical protein
MRTPITNGLRLGGSFGLALASGCYSGLTGPRESAGDDVGAVDDDGADDADDGVDEDQRTPTECGQPDVPVAALRRLTRSEYDHTAGALFGDGLGLAAAFIQDEKVGAFDSNASASVSEVAVEQYMDAAEILATDAVADLDAILPCDPVAMGEDECARAFVVEFGARAYRRPLADDEIARAVELFDAGRDGAAFADGVKLVMQGFLQSPYFLYHVESGVPAEDGDEVVALTDYELANRLSYFLWDSMPDDELTAVADAGTLGDYDVLEAQVRRMLDDPQAALAIGDFHVQWLGIDALATIEKDPELFPAWSPTIADAMTEETRRFSDWVVREGDGRLETLFSAPTTFADGELAALYGVVHPQGDAATAFVQVDLDPAQRSGLLTQAGVLAAHSHSNQTSPVFRGKVVRENLLCSPLPPPPDDVDDTPPGLDPTLPTKERFEQHRDDPACSGCHELMDPIGFGLEHYDAIGAWRTMDGENPVDAGGQLFGTDVDGEFDGALELADKLAQSETVRACVVHQWMRYGLGRFEQVEDACTEQSLMTRFASSDGDVRELVVAVATSRAMRYLRVGGGQ